MPLSAHWIRPGPSGYEAVWRAMQEATAVRTAAAADAIWLTEHTSVYTLGQAGRREHLLAPGDIPVVATDRGGQVTYHGPGQLVAYVLYDLRRGELLVKEYVRRLEEAVLQTLAACGLTQATRYPGAPGVYVPLANADSSQHPISQFQKIAALGVKIRGGCTYHGIALNVDMNLQPFAGIDPCGYEGLAATDLASQGVVTTPAAVATLLVRELQRQLAPGDPPANNPLPARTLAELVADFQLFSSPCSP